MKISIVEVDLETKSVEVKIRILPTEVSLCMTDSLLNTLEVQIPAKAKMFITEEIKTKVLRGLICIRLRTWRQSPHKII